jgi:hypothetical protein
MSNWALLNNHRVCQESPWGVPPAYWSTPEDGFNGMFVLWVGPHRVRCVASDGMGWKHVSVSIIGDNRPPKWGDMCAIKDLFWDEEDWVVQFHPAKSEYVNHHPGCLHLWQPLNEKLPTPPSIMVGPKL